MNTNARIFLSIFCGVGLGIMVGLELRTSVPWLLWVAPIIGGVFSYIAVDFRGAVRAIPTAFAAVRDTLPSKTRFAIYRWRFYTLLTIWTYTFLFFTVLANLDTPEPEGPGFVLKLTSVIGIIFSLFYFMNWDGSIWRDGEQYALANSMKETLFITPHRVIFSHIPRAIWFFCTKGVPYFFTVAIPWCAKQLRTFAVHWFKLVHSDERLICLAYAFLFTGLGLIVGGPSPLIWMVAGGLLGLVNYQIISVRWLKLVPVKQQKG